MLGKDHVLRGAEAIHENNEPMPSCSGTHPDWARSGQAHAARRGRASWPVHGTVFISLVSLGGEGTSLEVRIPPWRWSGVCVCVCLWSDRVRGFYSALCSVTQSRSVTQTGQVPGPQGNTIEGEYRVW